MFCALANSLLTGAIVGSCRNEGGRCGGGDDGDGGDGRGGGGGGGGVRVDDSMMMLAIVE